ncbi:MAG: aminotransferase class V-fold PLP-dependent enzyme [Candidatus Dojkabacteria bacterium]
MNKKDFPLLQNRPELVYLDNAATTQKPQQVINAIVHYYENSNANVHRGIYKLSEEATSLYEESRELVALFLGAKPEQIIFTPGATAGLNYVALGYASGIISGGSDDVLLTTEMEHHSNLVPWQQLANELKVKLDFVKVDDEYRLDLDDLEQKLQGNNVKILALTHMSNTLGTINPIEEIVSMVREASPMTKIVVDGAQYAPHFPLNLTELDVDFYSIAGHKLYGPTGIGVLYGKSSLLKAMDPVFTGGGMIRKVERNQTQWADIPGKFEPGTPNIAGAIGLGEAVRYLKTIGMDKIAAHTQELAAYTLAKLSPIENISIYGPGEADDRGGVFSFAVESIHAHDMAQLLDGENVAVRAGHHCNQVLMREVLGTSSTTRSSVGLYNDYSDIDKLAEAIEVAVRKFYNR